MDRIGPFRAAGRPQRDPIAALVARSLGISLLLVVIAAPLSALQSTSQEGMRSVASTAGTAIPGATGGEYPAASAPNAESARAAPEPDFLFGRPIYTITARMGMFRPRGDSQFHEFAFDRLTLERSDLVALMGGIEGGIWLSDHAEISVSIEGAGVTQESEYREWVEDTPEGELPIRQTTRIATGPSVAVGMKFYPLARGEGISQFVWVPRRVVPFVYGGIGATAYEVEQWGDWVDEPTHPDESAIIFSEQFDSDGASLLGLLGGGVDLLVRSQTALVLEARYSWGSASMIRDFRGFDPIDLSGLRLTAGLSYRF